MRAPSEADALILQGTLGRSWNRCTYREMYRSKRFQVRPVADVLAELHAAADAVGPRVTKLFVADGDALVMPMDHWRPLLAAARARLPNLKRVSAYAMARNVLEKSADELAELRAGGLTTLYLGPESGDPVTLKGSAKGDGFDAHVAAAEARPTRALFRTNHASNYLPLGGRLPEDRDRILSSLDAALEGEIPLRPEWARGLQATTTHSAPAASIIWVNRSR